jgi:hypothetical protein
MSRLRARIAERLLEAKQTTAMLTTFNEVDLTEVMALRRRHGEAFEKRHGVRLGFMGFFVAACALALRRFPVVNAALDGNEIVYHDYSDIGIAVSSPRGLVVPVLRNAGDLSLAAIEKQVRAFAERARDGKLDLDDLRGGTFTDHQRRGVRLAAVDPDPEPAAERDPRHAQGAGTPGRARWPGRDPADDVPRTVLRSPPDRRRGCGTLPGRREGIAGRSGAHAAGSLSLAGVHRGQHERRPLECGRLLPLFRRRSLRVPRKRRQAAALHRRCAAGGITGARWNVW